MIKQITYISKTSTGERYVTTSLKIRIALNNTPITPEVASEFLMFANLSNVTVSFSMRKTRRRWGTAWPKQMRIVLYRHSVWMLLHELAHIVSLNGGHDRIFARNLDDLHEKWIVYKNWSLQSFPVLERP